MAGVYVGGADGSEMEKEIGFNKRVVLLRVFRGLQLKGVAWEGLYQ